MLTFRSIVAVIGVAGFIVRPAGRGGAAALAASCATELALGARVGPAVQAVAPLMIFIGAAITLASLLERAGVAERAAAILARLARGRLLALFALTCATCALLTTVVSLDGAVVLMVPLLLVLRRRCGVPFAPFFTGVVVVANVASLALPQGNPTNLVVMARLGLSARDFAAHMFLPGLAATLAAVLVVAVVERRSLVGSYQHLQSARSPLSTRERKAVASLVAAAGAAWLAPLLGVQPWLPFAAVVAVGALAAREPPHTSTALRVGAQVGALLVLMDVVGLDVAAPSSSELGPLLVVAVGIGAAAALTNNLPVSVSTASLVVGSSGYAAAIGLAAGSMALPRGSVATLLALEAAGTDAPPLRPRLLTPVAAVAVLVATAVLWMTL
jgi:arsenical pump membrane protein